MKKKVLSEQSLFYGDINMPKGFEIEQEKLVNDIFQFTFISKSFPFSKTWNRLNTYITENICLNYNISLINKITWGNIFKPNEQSKPFLEIDPVNLKNSPDYILLYGVKTKNCFVTIYYDDNRRKGRSWDIELKKICLLCFLQLICIILIINRKMV